MIHFLFYAYGIAYSGANRHQYTKDFSSTCDANYPVEAHEYVAAAEIRYLCCRKGKASSCANAGCPSGYDKPQNYGKHTYACCHQLNQMCYNNVQCFKNNNKSRVNECIPKPNSASDVLSSPDVTNFGGFVSRIGIPSQSTGNNRSFNERGKRQPNQIPAQRYHHDPWQGHHGQGHHGQGHHGQGHHGQGAHHHHHHGQGAHHHHHHEQATANQKQATANQRLSTYSPGGKRVNNQGVPPHNKGFKKWYNWDSRNGKGRRLQASYDAGQRNHSHDCINQSDCGPGEFCDNGICRGNRNFSRIVNGKANYTCKCDNTLSFQDDCPELPKIQSHANGNSEIMEYCKNECDNNPQCKAFSANYNTGECMFTATLPNLHKLRHEYGYAGCFIRTVEIFQNHPQIQYVSVTKTHFSCMNENLKAAQSTVMKVNPEDYPDVDSLAKACSKACTKSDPEWCYGYSTDTNGQCHLFYEPIIANRLVPRSTLKGCHYRGTKPNITVDPAVACANDCLPYDQQSRKQNIRTTCYNLQNRRQYRQYGESGKKEWKDCPEKEDDDDNDQKCKTSEVVDPYKACNSQFCPSYPLVSQDFCTMFSNQRWYFYRPDTDRSNLRICPLPARMNIPPLNPQENRCQLDKDEGNGKALVPRFFYDKFKKNCEPFIYGGKNGNRNNFESLQECRDECMETSGIDCNSELDRGIGKALNPKWYYNKREQKCEQFNYSNKGGNGNNYSTKLECENACVFRQPNAPPRIPIDSVNQGFQQRTINFNQGFQQEASNVLRKSLPNHRRLESSEDPPFVIVHDHNDEHDHDHDHDDEHDHDHDEKEDDHDHDEKEDDHDHDEKEDDHDHDEKEDEDESQDSNQVEHKTSGIFIKFPLIEEKLSCEENNHIMIEKEDNCHQGFKKLYPNKKINDFELVNNKNLPSGCFFIKKFDSLRLNTNEENDIEDDVDELKQTVEIICKKQEKKKGGVDQFLLSVILSTIIAILIIGTFLFFCCRSKNGLYKDEKDIQATLREERRVEFKNDNLMRDVHSVATELKSNSLANSQQSSGTLPTINHSFGVKGSPLNKAGRFHMGPPSVKASYYVTRESLNPPNIKVGPVRE